MATFKIIQDVPVKSTADLRKIAAELNEDFVLINTKPFPCELGYLSLERFAEIAEYTDADMLTRRPIMLHALPSCSARFWATQRATSRHVLLPRRVHARTSSVSPSWLRSRVLMLSTTPFTRWQKTRLATLQDLQVSTRDTSSKKAEMRPFSSRQHTRESFL